MHGVGPGKSSPALVAGLAPWILRLLSAVFVDDLSSVQLDFGDLLLPVLGVLRKLADIILNIQL